MRFMQTESVLQTKNRSGPAKNRFSVALVPSEDSDQPGHLPSLIRVFPVRIERTVKTLIRLGGCPG